MQHHAVLQRQCLLPRLLISWCTSVKHCGIFHISTVWQVCGSQADCVAEAVIDPEIFDILVDVLEASPSGFALPLAADWDSHYKAIYRQLKRLATAHTQGFLMPSEWQLCNQWLYMDIGAATTRAAGCSDQWQIDAGVDPASGAHHLKQLQFLLHHMLRGSHQPVSAEATCDAEQTGRILWLPPMAMLLSPPGAVRSWPEQERSAHERNMARLALLAPSARVSVRTLWQEGSLLPACKEVLFRLGGIADVMHNLSDAALAAIISIMEGSEAADRRWLQSWDPSRSCRIIGAKRLAYHGDTSPCSLTDVIHIWRIPFEHAHSRMDALAPGSATGVTPREQLDESFSQMSPPGSKSDVNDELWAESQLYSATFALLPQCSHATGEQCSSQSIANKFAHVSSCNHAGGTGCFKIGLVLADQ